MLFHKYLLLKQLVRSPPEDNLKIQKAGVHADISSRVFDARLTTENCLGKPQKKGFMLPILLQVAVIVTAACTVGSCASVEEKAFDAVASGDDIKIEILLRDGLDINSTDKYGWTLLMHAVKTRDAKTILSLLEKGTDISIRNIHGLTAFDIAKQDTDPEILAIINDYYKDKFFYLLDRHDLDEMQGILSLGIDINIRDADGRTALIKASHAGYEDGVRFALEYGAKRDIKDNIGNTALYYAKKAKVSPVIIGLLMEPHILEFISEGMTTKESPIVNKLIKLGEIATPYIVAHLRTNLNSINPLGFYVLGEARVVTEDVKEIIRKGLESPDVFPQIFAAEAAGKLNIEVRFALETLEMIINHNFKEADFAISVLKVFDPSNPEVVALIRKLLRGQFRYRSDWVKAYNMAEALDVLSGFGEKRFGFLPDIMNAYQQIQAMGNGLAESKAQEAIEKINSHYKDNKTLKGFNQTINSKLTVGDVNFVFDKLSSDFAVERELALSIVGLTNPDPQRFIPLIIEHLNEGRGFSADHRTNLKKIKEALKGYGSKVNWYALKALSNQQISMHEFSKIVVLGNFTEKELDKLLRIYEKHPLIDFLQHVEKYYQIMFATLGSDKEVINYTLNYYNRTLGNSYITLVFDEEDDRISNYVVLYTDIIGIKSVDILIERMKTRKQILLDANLYVRERKERLLAAHFATIIIAAHYPDRYDQFLRVSRLSINNDIQDYLTIYENSLLQFKRMKKTRKRFGSNKTAGTYKFISGDEFSSSQIKSKNIVRDLVESFAYRLVIEDEGFKRLAELGLINVGEESFSLLTSEVVSPTMIGTDQQTTTKERDLYQKRMSDVIVRIGTPIANNVYNKLESYFGNNSKAMPLARILDRIGWMPSHNTDRAKLYMTLEKWKEVEIMGIEALPAINEFIEKYNNPTNVAKERAIKIKNSFTKQPN
ncbi:MAG: ankyrin repeat domain-containing protein [Candidatus Thiodiazotropha sp.]